MDNNSPPFEIVQAGLSDLQDFREMEKVCFPQDAWPLIEIIAALTFPATVRLKAVHQGKFIGFVGGDIRRSKGFGWITTLSVIPEYRRMGAANALLDACEKEMGMPLVKLCVRKSNLAAQSLYLRRGYMLVESWVRYYPGGEDALVLEKRMN
jgi:ribosomal-protein-alanine N-acetyltransferase